MVSGDINNLKIGDMFKIKNERFHIYSWTDTTITGLAEFNLYVGGKYDWNNSKFTPYGTEATGIRNRNMRGYIEEDVRKGATQFSNESKQGSSYGDYMGSLVEEYVNKNKNILESYGAKIEEARVISKDEIVNIFKCPEYDY